MIHLRPERTTRCRLIAALIGASTLLYSVTNAIPVPTPVRPHPTISSEPRLANPHLRGGDARPERPTEKPIGRPIKTDEPGKHDPKDARHDDHPNDHRDDHRWDHLHHHWLHSWSYTTWISLHRGLGVIRGIAYDAAGRATAGIHLALRWPGGKYIRNAGLRHTTYSGQGGAFVMSGVRLGTYRVRAEQGKAAGHTSEISVHPGLVTFVSVKA